MLTLRNVWYVWHALPANRMADDANTISNFFLELHWEDFQCDIRRLLSTQISRCLPLKKTEPPSAITIIGYTIVDFICNSDSVSFARLP